MKYQLNYTREQSENILYVLNMAVILCIYISWCCLTISYRNNIFLLLSFLTSGVALVIYSFINSFIKNNIRLLFKRWILISYFLVSIVAAILGIRLSLGNLVEERVLGIELIIWGIVSFILLLEDIRKERKLINKIICNQRKIVNYNNKIFILIIIVIILCLDGKIFQFKWDGLLYYETCQDLSLFSLSSLAIYGHMAQTYGSAISAASLVFGNVGNVMIALNISLLVLSSLAFYGIICTILSDKKEWIKVGVTAIYTFSPFYLGMVGYHNLDFYMQCLFPIVLYFLFKRNWLMFTVTGLFFCFTKETAIIVYTGLCMGQIVVEYMEISNKHIGRFFKRIICSARYYLMLLPMLLWLLTFLILGPWSAGESVIIFDIDYIIEKLKVLYVLNFNWLFTILFIIGFVFVCLKKIEISEISWWIIPIGMAQIFFTAFSCLFKTVNHPRYSDSSIATLYIIGVYIILKTKRQWISGLSVLLISLLMLLSCYRTIDPLSRAMFNLVDIGETNLITTYDSILGDGMIYNRQMLGMEVVMEQALDIALTNNAIPIISAINDSTYYFDGMADVENLEGKHRIQIQYWDDVNGRMPISTDSTKEYEVYYISIDERLQDIDSLEGKDVSYFYIDEMYDNYATEVMKQLDIKETYQHTYRGWTLHQVIGKIRQ